MKLSEIKGEAALDVLADIIEPASEIMTDPEIKEVVMAFREGRAKDENGEEKYKIADVVKTAIKSHKKALIEILAILDGVPVDEYEVSLFALPGRIIELFNDPELVSFFSSAEWTEDNPSSTAPTENIKETEKA